MKALLRSCLLGMTLFGIYAGVSASSGTMPAAAATPLPLDCPSCPPPPPGMNSIDGNMH